MTITHYINYLKNNSINNKHIYYLFFYLMTTKNNLFPPLFFILLPHPAPYMAKSGEGCESTPQAPKKIKRLDNGIKMI